tara:strand:- start:261 stop:1031 length:771 start_codon:yes stop_codon:yes gene_type:complete
MENWALILGASSGIGAECAKEFAKKGLNVYGIYLRKPKAHIDKLTREIEAFNVRAIYKKANAANPENRKKIIEEISNMKNIRIKVFIHSLAFGALKPFINKKTSNQLNQKNIEMTINVMCNSLIYWTQDLFHEKLFYPGSQIISMTSAGSQKQWQSYGAVSMAKAALESATRQLAFELACSKIACNCIQAGVTLTPALKKIPGYQTMVNNAKLNNPHNRLTLTTDVSKVAVQIGSSDSYWMTGNTIKVDGGESLTG